MIAVSVDSKLDRVMFYQVREQRLFRGIQIVLSRVKVEDRQFLCIGVQFFFLLNNNDFFFSLVYASPNNNSSPSAIS